MAHEHENVVRISTASRIFPAESTLYFPVVERPDGWQDRAGNWFVDKTQKKLVRVTNDHKPKVLATVGTGYKVIKNRELFPHIEDHMTTMFEPHLLRNVEVRDTMSYGGRDCYREYVFKNLRCDIPGGGDVAFRLIVGNSYGNKAVQLICGAIDFYCTNGMIIGMHERAVRKHTRGLTIAGLDEWITQSTHHFTRHTDMLKRWSHEMIPAARSDALFLHLINKQLMSERHASLMAASMEHERTRTNVRSVPTMWNLYSAMTAWASHGELRATGNDHEANTRLERERHANRVMAEAMSFMKRAA